MVKARRLPSRGRVAGMAMVVLGICCVAVLGFPPAATQRAVFAAAEPPIRVQSNAHVVDFGRQMRFRLELAGSVPITSVVLAYRTSDTQGTTVERMSFAPSTLVSVEHVHEIGQRYVRPFVTVSYWWTIVDATGARLSTDPVKFVYSDDRFQWQTLEGKGVNVHWYNGDVKIAQQALDATLAGLERAAQDVGSLAGTDPLSDPGEAPVEVYLYSNTEDLGAALPPGTPADVEALTLHEMNVILTSFGPEATYIPDLQRVLAHEAAHVIVHQATESDRSSVPLWLSEGLATSVQHGVAPDPDAQTMLEEAARQELLIPFLDLCATFPRDAASARLAYAQSASLVDLIRDRYGRRKLRTLIAAYADGATCEGGVYRVLGVSLEGLEAQWRASLAPQGRWATFWGRNGAYLILIGVIALPFAFVLPRRFQDRAARDEEE